MSAAQRARPARATSGTDRRGGEAASASTSRSTARSRWWANPAAASRSPRFRSWACCRGNAIARGPRSFSRASDLLRNAGARAARAARRRDLDDLPGADELAEPGVHRRLPGRARCCASTWALGPGRRAQARVELLDEVGLSRPQAKLDAYPFQLSGGQQQRVMIAMAIACEPKLLIADEPTTALDVTVQKQILDLIAALQRRRRMSVLFITHDLALVGEIAGEVVVMRQGEIREQGAGDRGLRCAARRIHAACCWPRVRASTRSRPASAGGGTSRSCWRRAAWRRASTACSAVKGASFKLAEGQHARPGRRIGLGQDDARAPADAPARALGRRAALARERCARRCRGLRTSARSRSCSRTRTRRSIRASASAQILTEPMRIHGIGADEAERRALAVRAARKGRAAAKALFYKYPHEFSGGQRQRIAIARCLSLQARHADLRRVGVGARRLDPGAAAEPAAGPAGRIPR